MAYPTDQTGRQPLADELTALGYKPTQTQNRFNRDKIDAMVEAIKDDTFDWKKASLRPVILGPDGEILGGHHRIVAAHLAGVDLKSVPGSGPQVMMISQSFRLQYDWIDVLPVVQ